MRMETDGEPLALGRPLGGLTMALPNSASNIKVQFVSTLGSLGSCGLEKDHFSSGDEAVEADDEDEAEPREDDNDSAAEATAGANAGWADAMARILSKKIPESKPTILVRNKELEKEKEKLKQERLEKRKQTEAKSEEGPGWTILRDDFMMGASMKDWDKESDGPDGSRLGCGSDSDT